MTSTPIDIIGGSYQEVCAFPRKKLYRGSGARAAAFLSSIGVKLTLHSITDENSSVHFKRLAKTFGYDLKEVGCRKEEIEFNYKHPLAAPFIYPHRISKHAYKHPIKTNSALVFGMLEGTPVVHAEKAVYDPQNGYLASSFEENGSSAKKLVIVLSYSEGKALTKETDTKKMTSRLLESPNVIAAIVKCGPQGALVATSTQNQWILPFTSSNVYKIGSGDIFSAAFAYAWLHLQKDPFESAWFASRACATYVESGVDRLAASSITRLLNESAEAQKQKASAYPPTISQRQIYLAGPFFTTAEQWRIDEAFRALNDMGFKVFSPIHEVGIDVPEVLATQDLAALENSSLVLAMIDGCDPGTIFEIGYARAKKIPVVAIAEKEVGEALTMLIGSGCEVVQDFSTGIYKACWKLMDYE